VDSLSFGSQFVGALTFTVKFRLVLGRATALGGEVRFKLHNVRFEQGDLIGLDPRNR
jgi:hypothetical protein